MDKIDRYKILIRHLITSGIADNQKDLGAKLGYSNESSFSQVINGKVPTPKDFIEKLKTLLPNLNDDWLLTGKGDMLKQSLDNITNSTVVGANVSGNGNKISHNDLAGIIKLQEGYQDMLKKSQEQIDRLLSLVEKLSE